MRWARILWTLQWWCSGCPPARGNSWGTAGASGKCWRVWNSKKLAVESKRELKQSWLLTVSEGTVGPLFWKLWDMTAPPLLWGAEGGEESGSSILQDGLFILKRALWQKDASSPAISFWNFGPFFSQNRYFDFDKIKYQKKDDRRLQQPPHLPPISFWPLHHALRQL